MDTFEISEIHFEDGRNLKTFLQDIFKISDGFKAPSEFKKFSRKFYEAFEPLHKIGYKKETELYPNDFETLFVLRSHDCEVSHVIEKGGSKQQYNVLYLSKGKFSDNHIMVYGTIPDKTNVLSFKIACNIPEEDKPLLAKVLMSPELDKIGVEFKDKKQVLEFVKKYSKQTVNITPDYRNSNSNRRNRI